MTKENNNLISRPPVVAVLGHIDHGKSTLLDFIRKSNIVDGEAGGITQSLSAYEVLHTDEKKVERKITFIDTPGHEAFSNMRERGAGTADIAILIVSAEDSVKTQTLEALQSIQDAKIPYIVAINKIDKPGANIEKVKNDLVEKGVYLEGYGGDIPFAEISAKVGTGIPHLLDLILLLADLNEFKYNPNLLASGVVIESNRDKKRGISATLLIKDGSIKKGEFVVVEDSFSTTRIIEDCFGKNLNSATACSPISIVGFDNVPKVGKTFKTFASKKEAEMAVTEFIKSGPNNKEDRLAIRSSGVQIPIIIKTDVSGTMDAIEKEIGKINMETISFKVINKGVGPISQNEIQLASGDKNTVIVGFNVKIDSDARDLNQTLGVPVMLFDIIYKLTDYLKELIEERRPREEKIETIGKIKIIKKFSQTKERQVVGGKVTEGRIAVGAIVKIVRQEFEIGNAKIVGLEQGKIKAKEVLEGNECGVLIESKIEIAGGDTLVAILKTLV